MTTPKLMVDYGRPTVPVNTQNRTSTHRRGIRLITAFGLASAWAGLLLLLLISALGAPSSYVLGGLVVRLGQAVIVSTVGIWVAARNAAWRAGSLVALSGGMFAMSLVLFVIISAPAP